MEQNQLRKKLQHLNEAILILKQGQIDHLLELKLEHIQAKLQRGIDEKKFQYNLLIIHQKAMSQRWVPYDLQDLWDMKVFLILLVLIQEH